jgi:hypothetical protein
MFAFDHFDESGDIRIICYNYFQDSVGVFARRLSQTCLRLPE